MELWKCTPIVQLISQLTANLQRGRTYNSEIIRSCMSFLSGGQLSTNKLVLHFVYIFIIPAQTGNGTNWFVIWYSKDMKLLLNHLIRSCMSFLSGGQQSTDKAARKLGHMLSHKLYISFPVWAGIKTNFSPNRKWNKT